jgi:hypothetical protein
MCLFFHWDLEKKFFLTIFSSRYKFVTDDRAGKLKESENVKKIAEEEGKKVPDARVARWFIFNPNLGKFSSALQWEKVGMPILWQF